MKSVVLVIVSAVGLCGCVNEAELAAKRQEDAARAACRRDSKTHLAFAKCEDALVLAKARGPNADLVLVLTTTRESIAEKQDNHLITDAEAEAAMAQTYAQLVTQAQQRGATSAQQQAAIAEMFAASQPPVVVNTVQPVVAPAPVPTFRPTINCTSRQVWNTVQTNCN